MRTQRTIALPLWKFVLYSFLTAGVFRVFWFFRTWKFIRDREHTDMNPGWGTVRMMLPVLNLFVSLTFFRKTYHVARRRRSNMLFIAGSVLLFSIAEALLFTPMWGLSIPIGYAPLLFCQHHLNQLRQEPRVSNDYHWTDWDRRLCIFVILIFAPFSLLFAMEMTRRALGMQFLTHLLLRKWFM